MIKIIKIAGALFAIGGIIFLLGEACEKFGR